MRGEIKREDPAQLALSGLNKHIATRIIYVRCSVSGYSISTRTFCPCYTIKYLEFMLEYVGRKLSDRVDRDTGTSVYASRKMRCQGRNNTNDDASSSMRLLVHTHMHAYELNNTQNQLSQYPREWNMPTTPCSHHHRLPLSRCCTYVIARGATRDVT